MDRIRAALASVILLLLPAASWGACDPDEARRQLEKELVTAELEDPQTRRDLDQAIEQVLDDAWRFAGTSGGANRRTQRAVALGELPSVLAAADHGLLSRALSASRGWPRSYRMLLLRGLFAIEKVDAPQILLNERGQAIARAEGGALHARAWDGGYAKFLESLLETPPAVKTFVDFALSGLDPAQPSHARAAMELLSDPKNLAKVYNSPGVLETAPERVAWDFLGRARGAPEEIKDFLVRRARKEPALTAQIAEPDEAMRANLALLSRGEEVPHMGAVLFELGRGNTSVLAQLVRAHAAGNLNSAITKSRGTLAQISSRIEANNPPPMTAESFLGRIAMQEAGVRPIPNPRGAVSRQGAYDQFFYESLIGVELRPAPLDTIRFIQAIGFRGMKTEGALETLTRRPPPVGPAATECLMLHYRTIDSRSQ